ncbi:hypothetical protein Pan216_50360 [Planctomycetes bacterium Pan216]|uniref:DUF1570 domain-containing protein n=1 Tax=Kolteria novifilia TaxID=2527975 RepID=A0A518BB35_9BACT|nr:hypothetical protein Pan216_50360 [Planctomycetes bacterium Pan216]
MSARPIPPLLALLAGLALSASADVITYESAGERVTVEGLVLADDEQGSVLFETRDGRHHIIPGTKVFERIRTRQEVTPYTKEELKRRLGQQLGPRFRFVDTKHYLVANGGDRELGREIATLAEKVYAAFTNFFRSNVGFKIAKPRYPLIIVVYPSRGDYLEAMSARLGSVAESTAGLYVASSNQIVVYDPLGGDAGAHLQRLREKDSAEAIALAERLHQQIMATIVHEAVQQVAHNTGLRRRDVLGPAWVIKGLAMYFETLEMETDDGWWGVGKINRQRRDRLRALFPNQLVPLGKFVIDDKIFLDQKTADNAYAQAWALTYYLAKSHRARYVRYLEILNDRPPMTPYSPSERRADFRKAFGKSPQELELEFRRYLQKYVVE